MGYRQKTDFWNPIPSQSVRIEPPLGSIPCRIGLGLRYFIGKMVLVSSFLFPTAILILYFWFQSLNTQT